MSEFPFVHTDILLKLKEKFLYRQSFSKIVYENCIILCAKHKINCKNNKDL